MWVNTATHVYHKEGSRFYGQTKKGKYVSEADAIKEGDRARSQGPVENQINRNNKAYGITRLDTRCDEWER